MKDIIGVSLPQLPNEIVKSARKTRLDAFAVALEGWRRGLKLKWYTKDSEHFDDMIIFGVNPPGRLFSLSSEDRTHYFFRTRGDKVTSEAVELVDDKGITKDILAEHNVPVPKGKGFPEDATDEEVIAFSKTIPFPIVFKPTNASLGDGVVTNIRSNEEFLNALNYVRHELGYGEVIVEQHVAGPEYRFYIVGDEVIAVYNRIPANITGDGTHTIEELIKMKNYERRQNARLNSCLIHIDVEILEFINSQGYDLTSIPPKREYLLLREKTNVSTGGDPLDVTDSISDELKQIAIDTIKAVPGLTHAGVDIIVSEDSDLEEAGYVLEINATAQIGGILYPLRGKARNIPGAIIDYYFPETKGIDTSKSKVYFDMSTVLEPMENRSALEVDVAQAPMEKLHGRKYTIKGNVQKESYHRWLKQQALAMDLHGYVKSNLYDEIVVLIAGTNKHTVEEFKDVLSQYPRGSKVNKVETEFYGGYVEVGFEIMEMYGSSGMRSIRHSLRKAEKEFTRLTRQKDRLEKDINHIFNSTSWKITKLLRKNK